MGKLNQEKVAFFERYAPLAMAQQQKYGIPASVTLAQMYIESAGGKSNLAQTGFVDGSFSPGFGPAGWAFVVTEDDKELARGSGITAFDAESRNIDGEVMASFQAMRWLDAHDMNGVICHDYEGIARWAKGEWQAKSNIAQMYVKAAKPYLHRVQFEKVAAHTGVKWNELVDKLAKEAIAKARKGK